MTLETFEWDNIWWEHTEDETMPRAAYIGDSISCALRNRATELSGHKLLFDGFGSSKALDNPFLFDALSLFARQQKKRALTLFNNGLHGFHLSDKAYAEAYGRVIPFLRDTFGEKLALVLTTYAADEHNERVIARNAAVIEIARQNDLPVIDLYAPSVEIARLHSDVYHFNDEGNQILARALLDGVRQLIEA